MKRNVTQVENTHLQKNSESNLGKIRSDIFLHFIHQIHQIEQAYEQTVGLGIIQLHRYHNKASPDRPS